MPIALFADQIESYESSGDERSDRYLPSYDTVLFRAPRMSVVDIYGDATTYYRPQVASRVRGVEWWDAETLFGDPFDVRSPLMVGDGSRVRLSAASKDYNYGVVASSSMSLFGDWYLDAGVDLRFGRSAFVDGVFRRDIYPTARLSKIYSLNHYFTISLESPITMRGLQSSASAEAFELTSNPLYNPSWGVYDGRVRNSRVRRSLLPELAARYQRPFGKSSVVAVDLRGGVSNRSTSRLGWYEAASPLPDYYRKMPSYFPQSAIQMDVEQMWRESSVDYTQINWARLVEVNQLSPSGSAHYVVESQRSTDWFVDGALRGVSRLSESVELKYGVALSRHSIRNFKVLDDLLGGDYLLDVDPYIGDYANANLGAQSNVNTPNREVAQGERFGYDYTLNSGFAQAEVGAHYRGSNLEVVVDGRFGDQYLSRTGHYENGRFEGALSYGNSQRLQLPLYHLNGSILYTLGGGNHLALRAMSATLPADGTDIFIQEEYANQMVADPVARRISMASLRYSFMGEVFSLDVDGYLLFSRDGVESWRAYDDLSYTYSDYVVSGIGSRSVGVDVVCRYDVTRELMLELALAAGNYTYDVAPLVTLYRDDDISKYSQSRASAVEGCVVGNAPQIMATSSVTYFVDYGLILSLDCSYAACRYIAPSFVRRTDRVVQGVSSPELRAAVVDQQRLDDVFDLSLSVVKSFWLSHDRRISLTARVNNILGTNPPLDYAREGSRVLNHSGGSTTSSYYLQPSSYLYGAPRTFYLSCNYYF